MAARWSLTDGRSSSLTHPQLGDQTPVAGIFGQKLKDLSLDRGIQVHLVSLLTIMLPVSHMSITA
jgi:hypothetical protein